MPDLPDIRSIAGPVPMAAPGAGEIAARPTTAQLRHASAQTVAVVVGFDGDLAVVEAGGRWLGIEGLPRMPPGASVRLALPAGFPSIGGSVEVRVWSGIGADEAPAVLSARLVTSNGLSWPAELRRPEGGESLSARILGDAHSPAAAHAPSQANAGSVAGSIVLEAGIVDVTADGSCLLATPDGEWLMATAMPGLFTGRRLKLLLTRGTAAAADAATNRAEVPDRPALRDAAVGLAALVARFALHGEGAAGDIAPAHAAGERRAGAADEHAEPMEGEPAGDGLDWLVVPERLPWDDAARVLLARERDARPRPGERAAYRRMVLALALSRLGEVQLDLGFGEDGIDLAVRTAGPLDGETAGDVRAVLASIAAAGHPFRGRLVERLLVLPSHRQARDLLA